MTPRQTRIQELRDRLEAANLKPAPHCNNRPGCEYGDVRAELVSLGQSDAISEWSRNGEWPPLPEPEETLTDAEQFVVRTLQLWHVSGPMYGMDIYGEYMPYLTEALEQCNINTTPDKCVHVTVSEAARLFWTLNDFAAA